VGAREDLGVLAWMVNRLAGCLLTAWRRPRDFYRWQMWSHLARVGTDSLPIVSVIALCTGIILALQAAQQLEKVGALSYVANLVGMTIITELGPLLTAIILAGRSGSAFTAEIASMQISQEVDALEVIGVDPVRYLVWPKLAAMLVMGPVLTVWADFVGIASGGIFSSLFLGLNGGDYFDQTAAFLQLRDFLAGIVKAIGFAATVAVIGCWQGFLAREGATDVGLRTTKAVVMSIFSIIILDLYFTTLNFAFR
jgi:phospholipid/cholesterol/gamma-HCH transport system permease protein